MQNYRATPRFPYTLIDFYTANHLFSIFFTAKLQLFNIFSKFFVKK